MFAQWYLHKQVFEFSAQQSVEYKMGGEPKFLVLGGGNQREGTILFKNPRGGNQSLTHYGSDTTLYVILVL